MTMHLLIKTDNIILGEQYTNHSHYHEGDSGLDLFCPTDILVKAGKTVKIDLQIQCEALKDNQKNVSYYLYPRSSIVKTPLRLANSVGIIDSGYRGNIKACFDNINNSDINSGSNNFVLKQEERYTQLCPPNLEYPMKVVIVDNISDLGKNTTRGVGGFGSTGN